MPLYEYQCPTHGVFELMRKFSDPPLTACPTCGEPVEKLLSAPAIQFKGTGWYITDYARKSPGGAGDKAASNGGKDKAGGATSDSGKSGSESGKAGSDSGRSGTDSGKSAATTTTPGGSSGGSDKK